MASTDPIDFDLDAVERDKTFKPFTVNIKGRAVTLSDPAELDYKELLEVETPIGFLRYVASQEDRDYIAGQKIEAWRLGKLMEAYYKHYGLDQDRKRLGF